MKILYLILLVIVIYMFGCQKYSDNNFEDIELVGKYIEGRNAYTKYWGYDCYILEADGTKHEVECIGSTFDLNIAEELINKTIKVKGIYFPPKKVPDDYEGPVPEIPPQKYWPPYVKIIEYEVLE